MGDKIFGVCIFIVGVIFFLETSNFANTSGGYTIAPSFFPRVVIIIMCLLAILMVVNSLRVKGNNTFFTDIKQFSILHWRIFAMLALLFIYIFIMPLTGFIIASMIFLLGGFSLLIQERSKNIIIASISVALIMPVSIHWLFENVLRTILP